MKNDNKRFKIYYNQFKDKIYAYFFYRVNFDKRLAEDLTADIFLKAFKKFSDFDGQRPFRQWIFTIARNHLINYYKNYKREVPLNKVENFLYYEDNGAAAKYELEKVMVMINQMRARDKEILLLRYAHGLTNTEIADHLDMDERAVRTQFSRSLAKLRKIIKK